MQSAIHYCLERVVSPTKEKKVLGFPGGSVVKNPPANAGDMGSNPRSRRSAGEGNDTPLHSILAWGMLDRGIWWATVHGITKESDMT